MALVTNFTKGEKERERIHESTECLYYVITDSKNRKYLQFDTFGSKERLHKGKTSQSIQFGPEAIERLKEIFNNL